MVEKTRSVLQKNKKQCRHGADSAKLPASATRPANGSVLLVVCEVHQAPINGEKGSEMQILLACGGRRDTFGGVPLSYVLLLMYLLWAAEGRSRRLPQPQSLRCRQRSKRRGPAGVQLQTNICRIFYLSQRKHVNHQICEPEKKNILMRFSVTDTGSPTMLRQWQESSL